MLKKTNLQKFKKFNFHKFPDKDGRFSEFGGRFVAETLMPLLLEVEKECQKAKKSKKFKDEIKYYFNNYVIDQVHFILLNVSKKLNGKNLF